MNKEKNQLHPKSIDISQELKIEYSVVSIISTVRLVFHAPNFEIVQYV